MILQGAKSLRGLLLGAFIFSAIPAPESSASTLSQTFNHCARQLGVLTVGVACDLECTFRALARSVRIVATYPVRFLPISNSFYAKIAGIAWDEERRMNFGITGRFLSSLSSVHLLHYDFSGKKFVNIASGESRLTQIINTLYAGTGGHGTSIDNFSRPPFPRWGAGFVQGDAFNLPLESMSQDLAFSTLFVPYYLPHTFSTEVEVAERQRERMGSLFNEFIRVTKPGGEVRIGLFFQETDNDGVRWVLENLAQHRRVKSIKLKRSLPSNFLHIQLNDVHEE